MISNYFRKMLFPKHNTLTKVEIESRPYQTRSPSNLNLLYELKYFVGLKKHTLIDMVDRTIILSRLSNKINFYTKHAIDLQHQ